MPTAPPVPPAAWRARRIDLATKVASFDPTARPPWVIEPLLIPQTLAIVAGQGGSGKTWVLHEAAHAVATAESRAGFYVPQAGRVLIVDAEMGEWLTVQRFAQQKYATTVEVMDATGLNLADPAARNLILEAILDVGPSMVGFDSLAALTAGADENGKEMGDHLNWMRVAVQQSNAAGLVIHHAGWKEERTRGSTTIRDRADAVWYWKVADDEGTRELNCHGTQLKAPRWCRPPAAMYMRLRESGGLIPAGKPVPPEEAKRQTQEQALRAAILNGGVKTQKDACAVVGVAAGNQGVRDTLKRIAMQQDGQYVLRTHGNGHDGPAIG